MTPFRAALESRYAWISRHARGLELLDVPCGMGWGTSMIRGCRRLVGVDLDARAVDEARRRYGSHAEFRVGDMGRLDFPDASFDAVACLEGIEHVPVEVGGRFLAEAQ